VCSYALVDRLSYLDWGLRTEDEVVGKRAASLASQNSDSFGGCIVHDGAIWGEAAHGAGNTGPKTARTSEGYGEATCATVEKLLRLLSRLTYYVPAMGGWAGLWNLDQDASFLDVGSGYQARGSKLAIRGRPSFRVLTIPGARSHSGRYGKVVFHAKLMCGVRCSVGIECVAKRTEVSSTSRLPPRIRNSHAVRR
jgi:hypothetical protein